MALRRRKSERDLERALRVERPRPSELLMREVERSIDGEQNRARNPLVPRLAAVAILPVAIVVSLAAFGALGYAASGAQRAIEKVTNVVVGGDHQKRLPVVRQSSGQDQYGRTKVTVCHNGHTIVISRAALPAHLRIGDHIGPC